MLLDGDAVEVRGIGFAGVKGFAGGFGRATLSAFGEAGIKQFVKEAMDETMKLEAALLRLRTPQRIAVLHYAPIRETVEGEPVEIFPWLGCGRLEEPINRYGVNVVVHGHAHKGAPRAAPRPACRCTTSPSPSWAPPTPTAPLSGSSTSPRPPRSRRPCPRCAGGDRGGVRRRNGTEALPFYEYALTSRLRPSSSHRDLKFGVGRARPT